MACGGTELLFVVTARHMRGCFPLAPRNGLLCHCTLATRPDTTLCTLLQGVTVLTAVSHSGVLVSLVWVGWWSSRPQSCFRELAEIIGRPIFRAAYLGGLFSGRPIWAAYSQRGLFSGRPIWAVILRAVYSQGGLFLGRPIWAAYSQGGLFGRLFSGRPIFRAAYSQGGLFLGRPILRAAYSQGGLFGRLFSGRPNLRAAYLGGYPHGGLISGRPIWTVIITAACSQGFTKATGLDS
jgi:hypothetical protein